MEEVPAYVHPGPIVPDVLTRQHEHRYELIWSGDHETCNNHSIGCARVLGFTDRGVTYYRHYQNTMTQIANIPEHGMAITHIVFDEPSMLYPSINEDDDDNDHSDEDYTISSKSNDSNDPDNEEEDIRTPVNPIISARVNQWQSSQWFSSVPYDYTQFRAFLDMGSGE
ncbi:hypothetical protein M9H77_30204 [Catharanthus roseus]|uniref:Uncharacterized protein n=1 Tax=Catharanthus roseus TaxID=4058 RepID=A0ACB9ZXX4_CATRO|nr:hypothetical protein M9H77_30204 [Catharanthus roseus]